MQRLASHPYHIAMRLFQQPSIIRLNKNNLHEERQKGGRKHSVDTSKFHFFKSVFYSVGEEYMLSLVVIFQN